jgi:uncharacterized protein YkwD
VTVRGVALVVLAAAACAKGEAAPPARDPWRERINVARAARGRPPLSPQPLLDAYAERRAREIARGDRPLSPDASLERVRAAGYDAQQVAEVVAQASGGVERVIEQWVRRGGDTYREALRPEYRDVGVGVAESRGVATYVLVLGLAWPDFFAASTADLHDLEAVRREMLERANAARRDAGRPPLRVDRALERAAQAYAETMLRRSHYGHVGPDGSRPIDRARAAGYRPAAIAENIARGQHAVAEVMSGWLASPGHRRNLLDPDYADAGFGLAFGRNAEGYEVYWVQLFARARRG